MITQVGTIGANIHAKATISQLYDNYDSLQPYCASLSSPSRASTRQQQQYINIYDITPRQYTLHRLMHESSQPAVTKHIYTTAMIKLHTHTRRRCHLPNNIEHLSMNQTLFHINHNINSTPKQTLWHPTATIHIISSHRAAYRTWTIYVMTNYGNTISANKWMKHNRTLTNEFYWSDEWSRE